MTCTHNTHVTVDNNLVSWREILGDPATNPKLLQLIEAKLSKLKETIDTDVDEKIEEISTNVMELVEERLKNIEPNLDPYKIKWNNTTIGAALDSLFKLDLSGTINDNVLAEKGKRFTEYNVTWAFNKTLSELTIKRYDNGSLTETHNLTATVTAYTFDNVATNTEFEVIGKTSDGETCTLKTTVTFKLKWYYGVLSDTNPTNAALINLASGYVDEDTVFGKHTFNCTGGKYLYYLFPENLHDSYDFITNGLPDNTFVYETKAITNTYDYVNNYIVYRNTNLLHGNNIHSEVHVDDWY